MPCGSSGRALRRSVLNVWGTPRWASSLPGRTDMQLNNPTWKIVKPARNEYTREFWSALVNHYRKFGIRRYEVWNEPHLPGFSCFWNDTPEHFAEMLADAASAIRGEDAVRKYGSAESASAISPSTTGAGNSARGNTSTRSRFTAGITMPTRSAPSTASMESLRLSTPPANGTRC